MAPEIRLGLLIAALALWITTHVVVVLGLFRKPHPLQGVIGLVLFPLAPVFAWQRGTRVRAILWGAFAALYIVSFVLAR